MGLARWTEPHFKEDEPSRVEIAKDKDAAAALAWRMVCKAVDLRDGKQCRCCDTRSDPDATGLLKRGHRHHLVYRSAGGTDTTYNLVTLCASCHSDEHRNKLRIEGDPDVALTFFRKTAEGAWFIVRRELGVRRVEKD
jgi:hypothetical protein